jgi:hypothetical protein
MTMKSFLMLPALLCAFSGFAELHAQTSTSIPTVSTPVPGARYEIIQSGLAVRDTFKLDRFSGQVYSLVKPFEGGVDVWAVTKWQEPASVKLNPTEPRFQLFMGGDRVRDVYLLDSATGQVWMWAIVSGGQLTVKSITDYAWVPMRDVVVMPKSEGKN